MIFKFLYLRYFLWNKNSKNCFYLMQWPVIINKRMNKSIYCFWNLEQFFLYSTNLCFPYSRRFLYCSRPYQRFLFFFFFRTILIHLMSLVLHHFLNVLFFENIQLTLICIEKKVFKFLSMFFCTSWTNFNSSHSW